MLLIRFLVARTVDKQFDYVALEFFKQFQLQPEDLQKKKKNIKILLLYMNSAKIRVAVRVRPLLDNEVKAGQFNSRIDAQEAAGEVKVMVDESKQQTKSFKFDHVFSEQSSQAQFYEQCEIDHMLNQIIEGYHATIFAYGQTGSGKTYTMEGVDKDNKQDTSIGLIPRAIKTLLKKIQQNSSQRQFTIYVSYLQIYNERIFDLLGGAGKINTGPQGGGLKLRWNAREQFTVENLFIYQCKTAEEILDLFHLGTKNRVTSSHKLNLTSSRSHSIFEIKIESIDIQNPDNFLSSKLELVDLAGSERISLTGAEGKQAKESIDINKSLFVLRLVINAVSDQIQSKGFNIHIPYRDSKLTCLLKQSIGGNSFCLMIACLLPGDIFFDENISTLQYASKATIITNLPQRNDDPKNKQILDLKAQILQLRAELDKANKHIEFLTLIVKNGEQKSVHVESINADRQKTLENGPSVEQDDSKKDEFQNQVEKYQTLTQFFKPSVKTEEDYDIFSDRLVDSINMVRELLLSNKVMREKEESSNQQCENLQRELSQMQRENFELREKLQQHPTNEQETFYSDEKQKTNSFNQIASTTQKGLPKKSQNILHNSFRKGPNYNQVDDVGFLPEQSTQFQRQLLQNSQNVTRELNNISQSGKRPQIQTKTFIGQQPQNPRNQSLPSRVPNQGPNQGHNQGPNQTKAQLPHIRQIQYQIQQSAAQQFFNEEEQQVNGDELTNFGRRTLYQNGYNQSQQKINGDDLRQSRKQQ